MATIHSYTYLNQPPSGEKKSGLSTCDIVNKRCLVKVLLLKAIPLTDGVGVENNLEFGYGDLKTIIIRMQGLCSIGSPSWAEFGICGPQKFMIPGWGAGISSTLHTDPPDF